MANSSIIVARFAWSFVSRQVALDYLRKDFDEYKNQYGLGGNRAQGLLPEPLAMIG